MNIHVCKQCGSRFEYCRMCVFRPIRYKDKGFCSKECYEASKIKVEPIVEEIIERISVGDIAPVEEAIIEEEIPAEIESETIVLEETPIIEITTVEESAIKNETYNAYKKKKKSIDKVHE